VDGRVVAAYLRVPLKTAFAWWKRRLPGSRRNRDHASHDAAPLVTRRSTGGQCPRRATVAYNARLAGLPPWPGGAADQFLGNEYEM